MEGKDETTDRRNVAVFFFFLFDIKLRVGSEKMENKRLEAVVTGEGPSWTNYIGGRRDLI